MQNFLRSGLGSSLNIWNFNNGNSYGLEILQKCSKMVKTKIQKVLKTNSYVW